MIHEAVRAMRADDSAELARLERDARAALVDQRGGSAHLAEVAAVGEWSALLERSDRHVLVGTIDDVVVGYLELVVESPRAQVRQVYVHPGARELGLGDSMLEAAADTARAAGCTVIEGSALPGDRDTKNLYERAGIVARKIIVSRPL
jgi:GNAT superfamily N-acetyltransferase